MELIVKELYKTKIKSCVENGSIVNAIIYVENECSLDKGEYSLYFSTDFIDYAIVDLIKECIDNDLVNLIGNIETEKQLEIIMVESGEWEDVFFNRYFEIQEVCEIDEL